MLEMAPGPCMLRGCNGFSGYSPSTRDIELPIDSLTDSRTSEPLSGLEALLADEEVLKRDAEEKLEAVDALTLPCVPTEVTLCLAPVR